MSMSMFNGLVLVLLSMVSVVVITASASAASVNVVVDNTSPQLIYSPTPCYEDTPTVCSIEWVLVQSSEAFNGSVTSTDGPLPDPLNISLPILPRVTLNFNGSGIYFFSGPNSTANASITLDDRPSVMIDTSRQHYQVTPMEDGPHVLVIEYETDLNDGSGSGVLEVDYFVIVQDEVVSTSSSTTSAISTPTPTSTSPPSQSLSSLASQSTTGSSGSNSLVIEGSRDRPSAGTIIAIAISASVLFLFALLAWTLSARHRRRRRAIKRENDILSRMKMPSEGDDIGGIWSGGIHISKGKGKQVSKSWWT